MCQKRRKLLNEIFQTERTYQHHLMLLTTLFLDPIKVSMVLPANVIDGIFSNIEGIQAVSAQLLEKMELEGVLHALLELAPYMKLYSLYANNFERADKLLEEWKRKSTDFSRLLQFQESCEEMQCLRLRALLITPVQRVPRYRLLLDSLLEKTADTDPDYEKLRDACIEIRKVATHINECIRQHENFQKMLSIQQSFSGDNAPKILTPGRLFLKEAPIIKITERGNSKERVLFLFNDILILAKKENSCFYHCREVFPLADCLVEQVLGGSAIGNGLFKIVCKQKSTLLCSRIDHTSWSCEIKNAISELHSNLSSLNRSENTRAPSVNYIKQKERKTTTSSLRHLTCSSTSSMKLPLRLRSQGNNGTPDSSVGNRALSLHDVNQNVTLGVDNHNFHSFTDDSSLHTSRSISGDKLYHHQSGEKLSSRRVSKSFSTSTTSTTSSSQIRHNWSVTEPMAIEKRPALHSTRKSSYGKIGCSSSKRKCRQSKQLNMYSKEVSERKSEYDSFIDDPSTAKRALEQSTKHLQSCSLM